MTRLPRIKAWQQALILAVVVQFFGAVTMTAFPWLHERLHHDAGSGHQCAVTVLLTGASDGSPVPPAVASGKYLQSPFIFLGEIASHVISPIFLTARVFEHAPPTAA